MLTKLVFASIIALGSITTTAVARSPMPIPGVHTKAVFSIEQRLKSGIDVDLDEFRFVLAEDGAWTYVETKKQSIQKRASGKLSRGQVTKIRRLLRTSWTVSHSGIACMAFAASYQQYSVNGKVVWTDEMCSDASLDRTSSKRLAKVMEIVNPLIASAN